MNRTQINITLAFGVLLSLLYVSVGSAYAYSYSVSLPVPTGIVNGYTMSLNSQSDSVFTASISGGSRYYLFAGGKVWGQCSPDMSGCTANRWKVKSQGYSGKNWAQTTVAFPISSKVQQGIGVAQHMVTHAPGFPSYTGYTSENGTSSSGGASAGCYYNGPGLHSNTLTGLPCP